MRISAFLFIVLTATLLLGCCKEDPSESEPPTKEPLVLLNYFDLIRCGTENEWTVEAAKNTLQGKWKQYQRINTQAVPLDTIELTDTIFLQFLADRELVISEGDLVDTLFWDVRSRVSNQVELFLPGNTDHPLSGGLLLCSEHLTVTNRDQRGHALFPNDLFVKLD